MLVTACDDGVVKKLGEGWTIVVCTLWDGMNPRGAAVLPLHIDGLDATGQIEYILKHFSTTRGRPEVLLLDSLTIAGFNIVSPSWIYRRTGIPTVAVYKRRPRINRIRRALEAHFSDSHVRMRVLQLLQDAREAETRKGKLYLVTWGVDIDSAVSIVETLQFKARIPEPLRFTHLLASSLSRVLIQRFTNSV